LARPNEVAQFDSQVHYDLAVLVADALEGADLLPGFRIDVPAVFEA